MRRANGWLDAMRRARLYASDRPDHRYRVIGVRTSQGWQYMVRRDVRQGMRYGER